VDNLSQDKYYLPYDKAEANLILKSEENYIFDEKELKIKSLL